MNKRKTLLLSFLLILVNLNPIYAKENPKILVSSWAINEISDAQIEGIIKSDKISGTKNFTQQIISTDLEEIVNNALEKLTTYNLESNPNYKNTSYSFNDISKLNICNIIYDISLKYDKDAINRDKIIYLKENNILKGNNKNIDLNKKCSYEEAITLIRRTTENLIYKQDKASNGMFYKIQKDGNTVYILGSIHIGDSTMYPINKKIIDAFNSSSVLFVEVNLLKDSTTKEDIPSKHKDYKTLRDDLGEELYKKYKKLMDDNNISESVYKDFKPWIAYNFLANLPIYLEMPDASKYGVDLYFLNRAQNINKEIKELENSKFQINLISNFDEKEYINMIDKFLNNVNLNSNKLNNIAISYKSLISTWKTGDSRSLNTSINKKDRFTNSLFSSRDIGMANKIENMLKSKDKKTYFVIAGAAHFTPEDSVLKILENRGYKIENLNSK